MKAARFVVDTHTHISTLYKGYPPPKGWKWRHAHVETYDNSALTLYDMETYGVNMCRLLPSWIGTTNEMQAMLVDKYPDKFVACCSDQTLKIKVSQGEAKWTLEAACEEIDAALKTGKFVGIGEFVPQQVDRTYTYTYRERLDEYRQYMDLAAKYNVVLDFHEWSGRRWGGDSYSGYNIVSTVAGEYPDVTIVLMHGGGRTEEAIKRGCAAVGRSTNIYLETGGWMAEYYEIPLTNRNVSATQLIWGHDYGNVPQYVLPRNQPTSRSPEFGASMASGFYKNMPPVPKYQTDFWRWALHQIDKIRDWVTQDEINLILGGNAAKIFKLKVPHPRMFPCGRPDLWGINWEKSVPFLPAEQIENPDTPQPYRW